MAFIKDNNKQKYDVINFRIVKLHNKSYIIEAQYQFIFKLFKRWVSISSYDYSGSRWNGIHLGDAEEQIDQWRNYYERLAEGKINTRKIIKTFEVRKRETHPEHFV